MKIITDKQREAVLVLEKANGNMSKAAQDLGINEASLRCRLKCVRFKFSLDPAVRAERKRLLELIKKQDAAPPPKEKPKFKRCDRPCRYKASEYAPNGCDYLSIVGHSRGCPAGEECTKFEEGERTELLMDEWRAPKVPEKVGMNEINLYAKAQRRMRDDYMAKKNR